MKYTNLILAIAALLLAVPNAFAALQVAAFSCNGETGTINIPNNNPFICTATINNPDSSTASLSSVKLYVDGDWATQSYSASGFSTSLSTGASTTAIFIDVTPTTAGSHKFSYILMDGVSDTFAADTTVNVMNIRIANAAANLSTAKQNNEFTVVAEIPTSGAMKVTASIEVSGCTLSTGEEASKSLGSMAAGAQTSVSWRLVMGASDCSYTVSVTGTGSGKVTDSLSGSVTSSTGSGDTGSSGGTTGGGGGGGGGGAALASESSIVPSVAAGGVATFSFNKFADLSIYEISLESSINAENAKLTVKETKLAVTEQAPQDTVYKYISIIKEGLGNDAISGTKVRFKIPNEWLKTQSIIPESITLRKLANNNWEAKPTKMLGKESKYTLYEANTAGFSIFAITGKKSALPLPPEVAEVKEAVTNITEVQEEEKEAQQTGEQQQEEKHEEAKEQQPTSEPLSRKVIAQISMLLAFVVGIIIMLFFAHSIIEKHHRQQQEKKL